MGIEWGGTIDPGTLFRNAKALTKGKTSGRPMLTSLRQAANHAVLLMLCLLLAYTNSNADDATKKAALEPSGKLLIVGSSTMAPMVMEISKRFQMLHPGARIEVQAGGSARGINDVIQGKVDIGMASRMLEDKEGSLFSFAIARDGVCLVLHKTNPVQNLTNQQITDIYTGKIANWSKVGGRDEPIIVINPQLGHGSVSIFTNFFNIKYSDIKAAMVVEDNDTRIRAIVENPGGITYMSVGAAEGQMAADVPIKLLPVDGAAATKKNIRTGNFPLSRPLLLLTNGAPTGLAKTFIDFSLSFEVTDIVEKHNFVPYFD
jgi:phosphate transport system substrate-binding protein